MSCEYSLRGLVLAMVAGLLIAAPLPAATVSYSSTAWVFGSYAPTNPGVSSTTYASASQACNLSTCSEDWVLTEGTATAWAGFGWVAGWSYSYAQAGSPLPWYYQGMGEVPYADAYFSLDGIEVTSPSPDLIPVSLYLQVNGSLSTFTSTDADAMHAEATAGADLQVDSPYYSYVTSVGGTPYVGQSCQYILDEYPAWSGGYSTSTTAGCSLPGLMTVGPFLIPPNTPFGLYLGIHTAADALVYAPGEASATAAFSDTFGFIPNHVVFDLPPGDTVNVSTPDGQITDDYWYGTPEPGSFGMVVAGLVAVWANRKRGASRHLGIF